MRNSITDGDRIARIERTFGLRRVTHRIGELSITVSEVRDVDRCVSELYPDCLVCHGDAPVWMLSWPAAFGLAEYLVAEVGVAGRGVLELGCGTAVVGVAAALAGARVTCTDYDPNALAMVRYNARMNSCRGLKEERLDWYHPDLSGARELVVGSEITYHEPAFEPLLEVLDRALAPGGEVVLSDVFRAQTDDFLELAAARGYRVAQNRRVVHMQEASYPVRIAVLRRPTGKY